MAEITVKDSNGVEYTVQENCLKEKGPGFPYYMRSRDSGLVLLFIDKNIGIVVKQSKYKTWPLGTSVTLDGMSSFYPVTAEWSKV